MHKIMARYKHIDMSPRLLPVVLEDQLVPGSFAHAVHHLVDQLDLSRFDTHYRNDTVGCCAYAPSILLKAVLLAYSQGIISSRGIERSCRDNVVFVAITGDAKPHFTTIADFIARSRDAIASVFSQVLVVLDNEGLIGREMFAIDGVKLPSNASKHRSGTRAEFIEKAEKLERVAKQMLDQHHARDQAGCDAPEAKARQRIERMTLEAAKIRDWLKANPQDRVGAKGGVRKSNLTDNESAKMATDKGVLQGFCGVAVVDAAHQVIVEASVHGSGSEQEVLIDVVDACAAQRTAKTLITADAGYHSETNLEALAERKVNALIADNGMRKRDERFADQAKHTSKENPLHDKSGKAKSTSVFGSDRFVVADDQSFATCPAGQRLHRNGKACNVGNYTALKFRAPELACRNCPLRAQCLRKPDSSKVRQVAVLTQKIIATHTHTMRARIDSKEGKEAYSRRIATVEPVFGNIRHNKRMNRFTLRGKRKVDGQWKLFALVHNIEKWARLRKSA
jgi:transposase